VNKLLLKQKKLFWTNSFGLIAKTPGSNVLVQKKDLSINVFKKNFFLWAE